MLGEESSQTRGQEKTGNHDNIPAHSAHLIKDFWAKNNTTLVQKSPYSPDLAPCDFWLFPKLETTLKGTRS